MCHLKDSSKDREFCKLERKYDIGPGKAMGSIYKCIRVLLYL